MGFRVIARKKGAQVRLYSRPGNDLTYRFPLIVETLARLRSRSCIIDGQAVGCDDNGVAVVYRVRYRHHDESIFLYAFDLIELNRDDLRPDSLEGRKATLEGLGQMTATSLNCALVDAKAKNGGPMCSRTLALASARGAPIRRQASVFGCPKNAL
jgi:ATP-dependent DNA ligase